MTVDQPRLRALLKARGWTYADLARRTGDSSQTIEHLVKTDGARCRASRRSKIARALQVADDLLAGKPFPWPQGFMVPDGFEFQYSARTQLAASRLLTLLDAPLQRDWARLSKEEQKWPPFQLVQRSVSSAFMQLMTIDRWRGHFIVWNEGEREKRGYLEPAALTTWRQDIRIVPAKEPIPTPKPKGFVALTWESPPPRAARDDAHEEAILSIIRLLEHVITPWVEGTAQLNYRAVRELADPAPDPQTYKHETPSPFSPQAILPPSGD